MLFRSSTSTRGKRKRLQVESLESRAMLAASDLFISEVHFRFQQGDLLEDQYLEIRGEPSTTIASGTYFVSVESDNDNALDVPGRVNSSFDLGGLTLGANGYLAFIQQNAGYSINSQATGLQGTTGGFKGLPNGRYTGFTGQFESVPGSESFLLIEAPVAPTTATDADSDDDGIIDAALNWTVLDSATVFKESASPITGDLAYGDIVFRSDNNNSTVPGGVTVVDMDELGYVARIGNSQGHQAIDWVGAVTHELTGGAFNFAITDGDNAMAQPGEFSGRKLDHLGSQNFVSSVSGTAPVGATIFVDRNNDGLLGNRQYSAEPDLTPVTSPQTNAFAGVTITGANNSNLATGFPITSRTGTLASTGSLVYSYAGNPSFSDLFRFRADFYALAESVSIDYIGASSTKLSIGRMEVYGDDNTQLETLTTTGLDLGEVSTMTITRPSTDIAYVVVYVDPTSPNGAGFLDYFRFTLPEESAVADANGDYRIEPIAGSSGTLLVRNLATGNTEAVIINGITSAKGVDFDGVPSPPMDIVGRGSNGNWNVGISTNGVLAFDVWTQWSTNVTWNDVMVADVNGDGLDDIVGRTSGAWWVAKNTGSSFVSEYWGQWSNSVTWDDVMIADVNGDGSDDIVGRTGGQWWVARANNTFFLTEYWGNWSNAVTWHDVMVGDFDGNGKADIAGRANGDWWVSRSQNTFFLTTYWGRWSNAVTWDDVMVADVDGDNRSDIVGRTSGNWWVSRSEGSFFTIKYWGNWSNSVTWKDVSIADVNGDNQSDIIGRANGTWWVSRSTGTNFVIKSWGNWSNSVTWSNVMVLDLNGDRMDDILGRTGTSFWASISEGGSLKTAYMGNAATSSTWIDVQTANVS